MYSLYFFPYVFYSIIYYITNDRLKLQGNHDPLKIAFILKSFLSFPYSRKIRWRLCSKLQEVKRHYLKNRLISLSTQTEQHLNVRGMV